MRKKKTATTTRDRSPTSPARRKIARASMPLPILAEVRACTRCAAQLPLPPRPLVAGSARSRLLIIGQAPGLAAHESGIPWNDRSGDRLREWLGISREQFYDDAIVALMPMGFCYPGKGRTGDAPPRPECAPLWHPRMHAALTGVRLSIFVGRFAFERYLGAEFDSQTSAVRASAALLPSRMALPHPSPLNNRWLAKNRWFERDIVPLLRTGVHAAITE